MNSSKQSSLCFCLFAAFLLAHSSSINFNHFKCCMLICQFVRHTFILKYYTSNNNKLCRHWCWSIYIHILYGKIPIFFLSLNKMFCFFFLILIVVIICFTACKMVILPSHYWNAIINLSRCVTSHSAHEYTILVLNSGGWRSRLTWIILRLNSW